VQTESKWRCIPPRTGALRYSDAACKVPAFYESSKSYEPQPTVGVDVSGEESGDGAGTATYHRLGALANPGARIYRLDGKDGTTQPLCSEAAILASANYYAVAAPIAPTSFVEMAIKTE